MMWYLALTLVFPLGAALPQEPLGPYATEEMCQSALTNYEGYGHQGYCYRVTANDQDREDKG